MSAPRSDRADVELGVVVVDGECWPGPPVPPPTPGLVPLVAAWIVVLLTVAVWWLLSTF